MKSVKESTRRSAHQEDSLRRASKLDPFNRSGKERHNLYKSINSPSDPADQDPDQPSDRPKLESVLDYYDDIDPAN